MEFKDKQKTLFKRVKDLRRKATASELIFMRRLDLLGIKFIFQKAFIEGDYYCIVDFYLPKPFKICIEIDGKYHDCIKQSKRDHRKDNYLESYRGFKVVRVKNEQVSSFDINSIIS
jgi:very-short-patch-repair endonuclease